MKIYTKTGDKGLYLTDRGHACAKHHLRIESYGTVDELNSYIGLIRDQDITAHDKATTETNTGQVVYHRVIAGIRS